MTRKTEMRSERLPFIDWMKAVGMFLIVYGHVATAAPFNTVPPINTKQLGVAFFIFVTGFTLVRETRDRWRVVFNRLFEVYLFGVAIALVVSVVSYATSGTVAKSNYPPFFFGVNVLFNFFPANPTTWYIGSYAHVLVLWAVVWRRYRIQPWMLAVSVTLEIAIRAALLSVGLDMTAYMLVPNWTTVFLLGMYRGQSAETRVQGELPGYLAALALLMVGWGLVTNRLGMEGGFPFMRLAGDRTVLNVLVISACVSFVYIAFTSLTFDVTRRLERPVMVGFFARNTLFIFIAHMPVYYALMTLMREWSMSYWIRASVRLLVCFVVLAGISEAITRLVKPHALRAKLWNRLRPFDRPRVARVVGVVLLAVMSTMLGSVRIVDASAPSVEASSSADGEQAPLGQPLLQQANLVYQGAIRLPRGRFCASPRGVPDSFGYGGAALAFDATRKGLYLVGHDWDQMTAEISIPTPENVGSLNALRTATVLQRCVDATEGKIRQAGDGAKIGGYMVYHGMLYGTVYVYYDASKSQTRSHFVRPLDLSVTGQVQGLFELMAPHAGFVGGYLSSIPSEWQGILGGPAFTGQCCIPIVSRTSYGPAAFAFDPAKLAVTRRLETVPLVYYEIEGKHFINDWNVQSTFFNNATAIGGAMFIAGTRTVLFVGRQGTGPFCYGTATPINPPPPPDGKSGPDGYCYDPVYAGYKGGSAYPYRYQIWAYDAADLASVANRRRRPWTIRPYGLWALDLPFAVPAAEIKGATYDPETRRLFLSQARADGGDMPLVHVFQANF